jgi:hypothetical protein
MYQMPKIDLALVALALHTPAAAAKGLSIADLALVEGIVAGQGKNKGCLRASKPNCDLPIAPGARCRNIDLKLAKIAYVWRMVAFGISPMGQHQCMPIGCDIELGIAMSPSPRPAYDSAEYKTQRDAERAEQKRLDDLALLVEQTVPIAQRHGTLRWGRALGML